MTAMDHTCAALNLVVIGVFIWKWHKMDTRRRLLARIYFASYPIAILLHLFLRKYLPSVLFFFTLFVLGFAVAITTPKDEEQES